GGAGLGRRSGARQRRSHPQPSRCRSSVAPYGVVALRTWVCVSGLVALAAALGCGRSRHGVSKDGEGGAPDTSHEPTPAEGGGGGTLSGDPVGIDYRPFTYLEFCLG